MERIGGDPSKLIHIAVFFDEPKRQKPIIKKTTIRNETTGKKAGVKTTKVVQVHDLSIDELPPVTDEKLSEIKPLPKLPEGRMPWQREDD